MLKNLIAVLPLLWVALSVAVMAADHTADSLSTVKASIADGTAVLVDVREPSEWKAGHIDAAVLVPLSELKRGIAADKLKQTLPQGKVVYTHCKAGVRCRLAADYLKAAGYEVRALKPGYQELLDAGFPKAKK